MADIETDDIPAARDFSDASPCPATDKELRKLAKSLRQHRIARAIVNYDGSGDSGSVAEIRYVREGANVPGLVEERLCDLAENYCPEGYEDNDGGYGTLTIYAKQGLAALVHFDRFEDSEDMGVHAATLPKRLAKRLANVGVTTVTACFDGFGDSGAFEDMATEPESATLDKTLADAVENFLFDLLPQGWEFDCQHNGQPRVLCRQKCHAKLLGVALFAVSHKLAVSYVDKKSATPWFVRPSGALRLCDRIDR